MVIIKKERTCNKLLAISLLFVVILLILPLVSAGQLKVTEEHPFLIDGKWIPAKDLNVGDKIQTIDGKTAIITNIEDVVSKNPFQVYNLEALPFNDFVVGSDNIVVHNSNPPNVLITPDGRVIPVPDPNQAAELDIAGLNKYANSASSADLKGARLTLINNIEKISFENFMDDMGIAVNKFNDYIGENKYAVVSYEPKSSPTWAYDLMYSELRKKPEGFIFIEPSLEGRTYEELEAQMRKLFDKGIRKFVMFDVAAYTGGQTKNDFGWRIIDFYRNYKGIKCAAKEPVEVIAVNSRATSKANFVFSSSLNNLEGTGSKAMMISGETMNSVKEIFKGNPKQLELLEMEGITELQTVTFFDFNVADPVSFPKVISDHIFVKGTTTPFRTEQKNLLPYWQPSSFLRRWDCISHNPILTH